MTTRTISRLSILFGRRKLLARFSMTARKRKHGGLKQTAFLIVEENRSSRPSSSNPLSWIQGWVRPSLVRMPTEGSKEHQWHLKVEMKLFHLPRIRSRVRLKLSGSCHASKRQSIPNKKVKTQKRIILTNNHPHSETTSKALTKNNCVSFSWSTFKTGILAIIRQE